MSLEARAGWARKSSTHAWSSNTGGPRPKLEAHTATTSGPVCNSMRDGGYISGLRHRPTGVVAARFTCTGSGRQSATG
jgi:hypothetical protein